MFVLDPALVFDISGAGRDQRIIEIIVKNWVCFAKLLSKVVCIQLLLVLERGFEDPDCVQILSCALAARERTPLITIQRPQLLCQSICASAIRPAAVRTAELGSLPAIWCVSAFTSLARPPLSRLRAAKP
jgi:hypothetical protein